MSMQATALPQLIISEFTYTIAIIALLKVGFLIVGIITTIHTNTGAITALL